MPGRAREPQAQGEATIRDILAGIAAGGQTAPNDSGGAVYYGTLSGATRPGLGKSESSILGKSPRDDLKNLDEANAAFYGLNAQQLADFQQRIVGSGVVTERDIFYGDYDDTTYKVWQMINDRSARFYQVGQNRTPSEILDMIGASRSGLQGEGEQDRGRVQTITSQVSLEEQVQASARNRLGRKLTAKEVAKFTSVYQGLERGNNAEMLAADNAAQEGGDSTVTNAPDAGAAASQYLDADFATEEAGQATLGYLGALEQMLEGR